MTLFFSIIIPGFNRIEPLKYTLRSVSAAASRMPAGSIEIILVDDGSDPTLAEQLAGFDPGHPVIHIHQENQGSIVARLAGLAAARGRRVLFLDSDDLISPEKLLRHHETSLLTKAEIIYDDLAKARLGPGYSAAFHPCTSIETTQSSSDFLLRVQPVPHVPSFDRVHLVKILSQPLVAPERKMDPSGDVWLYYNLAPFPAGVSKMDAALSAIGPHEENRYSRHWEKLAVAALLVAEAFQRACPETASTLEARRIVGEIAFDSWRRLPRDFHPGFARRQLDLWHRSPHGPVAALGGCFFKTAALIIGPVAAGKLHKRCCGHTYASCRTLDDAALARLLADCGIT
jgi:glycosyltransferase involved in cell wall biosynthesis